MPESEETGPPPGLKLGGIAHRVQRLGDMYARIGAVNELGVLVDVATLQAWLMTAWLDARVIIEFLTNHKGGRSAKYLPLRVAAFVPRWAVERELRDRLNEHRVNATHHVAHHFEQSDVADGFPDRMALDVLDAVDSLLAEMDRRGAEFVELGVVLRASASHARRCVENPLRWSSLDSIVDMAHLAKVLGLDPERCDDHAIGLALAVRAERQNRGHSH